MEETTIVIKSVLPNVLTFIIGWLLCTLYTVCFFTGNPLENGWHFQKIETAHRIMFENNVDKPVYIVYKTERQVENG